MGADLRGVAALEHEHPLASDSKDSASAVGVSDDDAASVVGVWVAAHEIEPLELVYELGDGLARDAGMRARQVPLAAQSIVARRPKLDP